MVYKYFNSSASRTNRLLDVERLLDDTPELKVLEPIAVRWLSLEAAVTTLYRIWPAVFQVIEHDATTVVKAKGILNKVIHEMTKP